MSAEALVAAVWVVSLQAAIVLAAAALVVRAGRRWTPALRLRIVQAALAMAIAGPLVCEAAGRVVADGPAVPARGRLVVVSSAASAGALNAQPGAAAIVAGILMLGGALRLTWIAFGLRRLRRGVNEQVDRAIGDEIDAVQRALGTQAQVQWRADVAAPSTFGRRPAIVLLPLPLAEADPATRGAVVRHELLHVRRGDWSAILVEEGLRAVFWFHPGVHWAVAELRLTREQLVDREVVALTGARRPYLELLLSYGGAPSMTPVAASPFFGRRQLERRIRHLTEETTMTRRFGLALALSAGLLAMTAAAASAMFPLSAGQQAAGAEEKTLPKVIHSVDAVYPEAAKDARVQGTVVVDVTVDTDGRVVATKVRESIPALDAAAEEALRQWIFEPGKVKGEPVKVTVSIAVRFSLK